MTFKELNQEIIKCANMDFVSASNHLETVIFALNKPETLDLILEIGTIPENIAHDSTEEKLYTKISDILFAKALKEMNFTVQEVLNKCNELGIKAKDGNYELDDDAIIMLDNSMNLISTDSEASFEDIDALDDAVDEILGENHKFSEKKVFM